MLHPTTFLPYGLLHIKNLKLLPHHCKDTQSKWLLSRSFALQETTNWDTSTRWRSSGLNLRSPWRDDIVYYTWFRIELDRMKEYNTLSLDLFYYDTMIYEGTWVPFTFHSIFITRLSASGRGVHLAASRPHPRAISVAVTASVGQTRVCSRNCK